MDPLSPNLWVILLLQVPWWPLLKSSLGAVGKILVGTHSLRVICMARWLPRACLADSITINSLRPTQPRDGGQLKHWGADPLILGVSSEDPKWFCYSFRTCHQEPTSSQQLVKRHTSRRLCRAKQTHTCLAGLQSSVAHGEKSKRSYIFIIIFGTLYLRR